MTEAILDVKLEELHRRFVEKTGRTMEPFRFAKSFWRALLLAEEYQGDSQALWRDVSFVFWYLKKQIEAKERRAGSLKLRNLLVPARFFEDLAEGLDLYPKAYATHSARFAKAVVVPLPAPGNVAAAIVPSDEDRLRQEALAGLRAIKEQLAVPSLEEARQLKSANPAERVQPLALPLDERKQS